MNINLKIFVPILLLVAFANWNVSAEEQNDKWKPVRFLVGEWENIKGESKVSHIYKFVLQDKFIQSKTHAEFPPKEDESKGEVHEDVGFFIYDPAKDRILFRQFLSGGFVNTYGLDTIDVVDDRLIFLTEYAEGAGGMSARLIIDEMNDDQYTMHLASPGKDFFRCQTL